MQQGLVLYDKQVHRVEHAVTHRSDSGVSKPGKGRRSILKDISEDMYLHYHRQGEVSGLINDEPVGDQLLSSSRGHGELTLLSIGQ